MKELFLLLFSLVFFMLFCMGALYAFLNLNFFIKSIFIGFFIAFMFLGFSQMLENIFEFYKGLK
ncbi:hypothetical protein Q8V47_001535 [Campylobacter jejuni]|uniref:Uncharacterized protein n=1 Tax=Campylobacter jejuni TaxID=197 RepID=A0A5T1QSG6_CAMJU|nr:hypothetical protein [Campylobacter jejuni]EAI2836136.1 hypothetical protein [Campylobacter jejuni]EAI5878976.1 hypothetical protein [Campylobacter jejuni]EAI7146431.1 hypothetical protein [Campylobacter jejuni]EAI8380268.1 hypothetical protein [Campylobacter jejuni]